MQADGLKRRPLLNFLVAYQRCQSGAPRSFGSGPRALLSSLFGFKQNNHKQDLSERRDTIYLWNARKGDDLSTITTLLQQQATELSRTFASSKPPNRNHAQEQEATKGGGVHIKQVSFPRRIRFCRSSVDPPCNRKSLLFRRKSRRSLGGARGSEPLDRVSRALVRSRSLVQVE